MTDRPPAENWPQVWIDPATGERQTTLGRHRSGPYAKPLRYSEYDENAQLACWNCDWRGPAREGSRESYEELFDISCPRCETMLLIVSTLVTLEERNAAAAAGHPGAQTTVAEMEQMEARR
ncbi:MAG: hypothetical protein E6G34_02310 [Actinobacteria bacterium]|nr:MAG: hypothetical protein E6G34_02310 [Actinomycetota bacterium]